MFWTFGKKSQLQDGFNNFSEIFPCSCAVLKKNWQLLKDFSSSVCLPVFIWTFSLISVVSVLDFYSRLIVPPPCGLVPWMEWRQAHSERSQGLACSSHSPYPPPDLCTIGSGRIAFRFGNWRAALSVCVCWLWGNAAVTRSTRYTVLHYASPHVEADNLKSCGY